MNYGMFVAKRFVAGTTIVEAISAVRKLNDLGMSATLDCLGEDCSSSVEAANTREVYGEIVQAIAESGVQTNLSLKLSALGLQFDPRTAQEHLEAVLKQAASLPDPFVRIDMERSDSVEQTLNAFRAAFERYRNCGPVLQAYLKRTPGDLASMIELGARVRLCKGAYDEKPAVAHTDKALIRREYMRLAEALLTRGRYPGIATHDPGLIDSVITFSRERSIRRDAFEFQMLYGVSPSIQRRLVRQGFKLRVYVPFGTHWAGYLRRRIMERRANAFFALSALFSR
jgi:proline dehydrogenase